MNKSSKTSKATGPTYRLIQIDDDGTRTIGTGFSSPRSAACSIAGVHGWLDDSAIETLATTWNACHPDGAERFEIGQE